MKRRIDITVETKRLVVITNSSTALNAWCVKCAQHVAMLSPEAAGLLAGITARTIYRHVDDGRLHFTETGDGKILVCSGSVEQINFHQEGEE